jgi:amidase
LLGRPVQPDDVEPLTWALYQEARELDALQLRAAQATLAAGARRVVTATLQYDAIVTPALAQPPVPIGTVHGSRMPEPLAALQDSDRFTPYTAIWNMTGQPAISLPLSIDDDALPLGVQLVGRPADEATLLALAASIEQRHPWTDRMPSL